MNVPKATRLDEEEWRAACVRAGVDGEVGRWRLAVPVHFDTAIGYWTGEPDWDHLAAALDRFLALVEAQEVVTVASEAPEGVAQFWLPHENHPGRRALIRGAQGCWRIQVTARPLVLLTAGTPTALALLRQWAAQEALVLIEDTGDD